MDQGEFVPPQNLDAEESLLGSMMLSEKSIVAVGDIVRADDFYRESHGAIFSSILSLHAAGEPADAIAVAAALSSAGKLGDAGGRTRLRELASSVPVSANAAHYARLVAEKAVLRRLVYAGHGIADLSMRGEGEVEEILGQAEEMIFAVAMRRQTSDFRVLADVLADEFPVLERRYERDPGLVGVATGFVDLDRLTCGLEAGTLTILAARPAMGKSAFALNVASNIAIRQGRPAGLFTLEMSEAEIIQRVLSSESQIPGQRVRTGSVKHEEFVELFELRKRLEPHPLYIDDGTSSSITDLASRARRLKVRAPELALLIVDYLQLLGQSIENRTQELAQITRSLKMLAKAIDIPILCLSQLSRAVEARANKRPMLSDLRDSGSIEQDADVVMFLYRDDYYKTEPVSKGTAELIVAKQRNGPTGTVRLSWREEIATFGDLAHG